MTAHIATHTSGEPTALRPGFAPGPPSETATINLTLRDAMWRLRADLIRTQEPPRLLLFGGAMGGEGATTLALHYAAAAAELGRARTLLVDADLVTRGLTQLLGATGRAGLTDWKPQERPPVAPTWIENLKLLPAGSTAGVSLAVVAATGRFDALLDHVRHGFDDVVFDGRPLGSPGDAKALVPLVGGVVLVTESDVTPMSRIAAAGEQVRGVGGSVVAVLRNRAARYTVGGLGFGV